MKSVFRACVAFVSLAAAQGLGADPPGAPVLKESEVVFMYASTPEAYKAYGATFVAWGGAETPEKVKLHRELGIRCTGSVWCLTAGAKALFESPALREAVAVDIEGKPIAVPWLFDHVHEGQASLFGNTNHPVFREHVKNEVRRAMAAGADGLHVDDHLGVASPALWYGGGFDDYSIAGFRKYLAKHASAEELRAAGVEDLEKFDFRELVRRHARTRDEVRKRSGEIPLFERWKAYHLEAAADFVEELGKVAAEAAGHPVLLSANACLENEAHHHVVPRLTHVVCEVWFHAHMGTRGLEGAFRAFEAADRLKRPLACTASGQDWAYVKARGCEELARFWIALTYAHGHKFMVPHPSRQWCFTEELGTHWYAAPVEEFAPLYRFIRANADLFDGLEAAGDVRVEAPGNLLAKARKRGDSLAVHLVNLDYDQETRKIRAASGVKIAITGYSAPKGATARLLAYDRGAMELPFEASEGRISLVIPEARIWSLIAISPR